MIATRHHNKLIRILLLLIGTLLVFISNTDPKNLPIALVLVPAFLIFGILLLSFYLILRWTKLNNENLSSKYVLYSLVCSGVISSGLLLRSVNQLSGRDVLLGTVFLIIISIYTNKLRFSFSSQ